MRVLFGLSCFLLCECTGRLWWRYRKGLLCLWKSFGSFIWKSPGVYIAYAESICVAAQDAEGFIDALQKALAIDANENPATRLQTIIAQEKANYLMDTIDIIFILGLGEFYNEKIYFYFYFFCLLSLSCFAQKKITLKLLLLPPHDPHGKQNKRLWPLNGAVLQTGRLFCSFTIQ